MKYLKWLLPLYVAAFPYLCLAELYMEEVRSLTQGNPFVLVGLTWLAGLAAALAVFFTRDRWTARELALANMLIKLIHVLAYLFWFGAGVLFFLFMGAPLAFLMDVLAISLSGLVGLAAVLNCRKKGRLAGRKAVLQGILQFVFCADVFSAMSLYGNMPKNKEEHP